MTRKKVLFFVEAMGGGVFTYIVDLANELVNEYDMYVAYAVRLQTPENYKEYFDTRINLIEVKNYGRSINPTKDIKALFEMKRIAKEIKPDVIHLHSSKSGALGRVAFDGKKIPLFYTPHAYSFLMKNHSAPKRVMFKVIETLCAKTHCTTISCSKGEHEETLRLTPRAKYVSNGININDLKGLLDTVNQRDEKYKVFTLGRICHQKNPKLFNEIALAMPDEKFLWIGDGELREELTAPNITITGWVDRQEALKLSGQGEVFVLTSLWEGLPFSLLEAMYMKKLCVVNSVIGNRDVIKTGVNGFVCDSVDDFVKGIQGGSDALIEKAYQEIEEEYNTKVMGKKYSEIYEDALKIFGGGGNQLNKGFLAGREMALAA